MNQPAVSSLLFALGAVFTGLPHRDLHPGRGFRFGQGFGKGCVELPNDRHPLPTPLFDVIELFLHARGEGRVDDVGKVLDQPVIDGLAQVGWGQPALFLLDVVARLDDLDGRCEGARTADAQLFQRLDQGGLGVSRWRLGEVLLGLQLLQVERLVDIERGQFLLFIVVAIALPDAVEAVEDQHRAIRTEQVVGGPDIDARLGVNRCQISR